MERHDPLCQLSPGEPAQETPRETPKPKRQRKQPPLLRELAEVKNEALAFLYGGPQQQKSDYERNLARAETIRHDFTAFCAAHPHFSNWRQAWAAFMAQRPKEIPVAFAPVSAAPIPMPVLKTPAITAPPRWRQRLQAAASVYGTEQL